MSIPSPTLADALAAMHAADTFFAYRRHGSKLTTLWRKAERYGFAPVTPAYMQAWLRDHLSANPAEAFRLHVQILSGDLSGFTPLSHETASLVLP